MTFSDMQDRDKQARQNEENLDALEQIRADIRALFAGIPTPAQLNEMAAEFMLLPGVARASGKVTISATLTVDTLHEQPSFEQFKAIYEKEMALFDKYPDLSFNVGISFPEEV